MAKNTHIYRKIRKWFDTRKTDSRWGIISILLASFMFFLSLFISFLTIYLAGGNKMTPVLIGAYISLGFAVLMIVFIVYLTRFFFKHHPKDPLLIQIKNRLSELIKQQSELTTSIKEWMSKQDNTNVK